MKFSMVGPEIDDILIEVTIWAGSTVNGTASMLFLVQQHTLLSNITT